LLRDFVERQDDAVERLLFLAEFLGPGRVVPDGGVLQGDIDFFELRCLGIVVKDTSEVLARDVSGRAGCRRYR